MLMHPMCSDLQNTLDRRRVRVGRKNHVLRTPGRRKTSGKLSYGLEVGRPLNVTSECDVLWTTLAEWVKSLVIMAVTTLYIPIF